MEEKDSTTSRPDDAHDMADQAKQATQALTQQSDQLAEFVRERPLVALGCATAVGFLFGRVIGRS